MNESQVPNATAFIVSGGEVIFEQEYGFSNIDQQSIVDPAQTLFRIGSTSKLYTWTAIMQLVEDGKLDLDININEYIDFELPAHLEFEPDNLNPQPITLRHLMTHTPGFEDYSDSICRLC